MAAKKLVNLRVDVGEHARWVEAAKAEGLSVSAWLRGLASGSVETSVQGRQQNSEELVARGAPSMAVSSRGGDLSASGTQVEGGVGTPPAATDPARTGSVRPPRSSSEVASPLRSSGNNYRAAGPKLILKGADTDEPKVTRCDHEPYKSWRSKYCGKCLIDL